MLNNVKAERMVILSGARGDGKNAIAKYAVKYLTNRNYFMDGAYEIVPGTRPNCQGFLN